MIHLVLNSKIIWFDNYKQSGIYNPRFLTNCILLSVLILSWKMPWCGIFYSWSRRVLGGLLQETRFFVSYCDWRKTLLMAGTYSVGLYFCCVLKETISCCANWLIKGSWGFSDFSSLLIATFLQQGRHARFLPFLCTQKEICFFSLNWLLSFVQPNPSIWWTSENPTLALELVWVALLKGIICILYLRLYPCDCNCKTFMIDVFNISRASQPQINVQCSLMFWDPLIH